MKREKDKARQNDDTEKLRKAKRNKLEVEFEEMKLRKELADDAKRHREFEVKKVLRKYICLVISLFEFTNV